MDINNKIYEWILKESKDDDALFFFMVFWMMMRKLDDESIGYFIIPRGYNTRNMYYRYHLLYSMLERDVELFKQHLKRRVTGHLHYNGFGKTMKF